MEEGIVTSGCASSIVTDDAVVTAAMCSADSVKLRASEGPGLSHNSKSRPGHKGPGTLRRHMSISILTGLMN